MSCLGPCHWKKLTANQNSSSTTVPWTTVVVQPELANTLVDHEVPSSLMCPDLILWDRITYKLKPYLCTLHDLQLNLVISTLKNKEPTESMHLVMILYHIKWPGKSTTLIIWALMSGSNVSIIPRVPLHTYHRCKV